ncbi:MAG: 50S ribosomal protein L1 [Candidatus Bipolaricaulia bacterium]
MRRGKRYLTVRERIDRERVYPLDDALNLVVETATARFDETAEAAFRLGVNPSQHMIRGAVSLPHGIGRQVVVLAFAKGERIREAEAAGADYVGGEELAEKIQDGWLEFDRVVATPDTMEFVGRLGPILGPRGMMPNPKSGTVTQEIGEMIRELKQGRLEFRVDSHSNLHTPFGKASFPIDALRENFIALTVAVLEARPNELKGKYLRGAAVSSTMGPGIKLDIDEVHAVAAERML